MLTCSQQTIGNESKPKLNGSGVFVYSSATFVALSV